MKKLIVDSKIKAEIDISIESFKRKIWAGFQERLDNVEVFGSYKRETFLILDSNADVDILVIFKDKKFQPNTYLSQIRSFCEDNYSRSEIYQDHPTIVIEMNHIKFEIVPSCRYTNQIVKIPAPKTVEVKWINTAPEEFKDRLEKKDKRNYGLIIPLIRILKYWNMFNDYPFNSYDIEKAITSYLFNCKTLKEYFKSAILCLADMATSEKQKKTVTELKEYRRRLNILESNKLYEYINLELESFLPMPK